MPRPRLQPGPTPDLVALYTIAEAQLGHFTTEQATAAGFSAPLLHHHVRANRFERVARGIYRLVQFPPGDHEDLMVAWLWSAAEGTFSHETALSLHELSDALPSRKHLTLPLRWKRRRVQAPPAVELYFADLSPKARGWKGAVPVTVPLRTVLDCLRDHVDPMLVAQACEQGLTRGLLDRDELITALTAAGHDPRLILGRGRRLRVSRQHLGLIGPGGDRGVCR